MRKSKWHYPTAWAGLLAVLLAACGERAFQLPPWQEGRLLVLVSDAAQGAETEFERELVVLFGEHLQVSVEIIPLPQEKIAEGLRRGRAHLAAATLRGRKEHAALRFGPSYQSVREQVICNSDGFFPKQLDDLANKKLGVIDGSAQKTALREARKQSPQLQWLSYRNTDINGLLREVSEGMLDCAVANELQFADARNYYPNLAAAFDIGTPSRLAWAFPRKASGELLQKAQEFFARIEADGTLKRLLERYYGHSGRLHPQNAASFITKVSTLLPDYRAFFEEAAASTGFDWRLLAALAYQESQWNPLATSFTNVRGMMMLTGDTADRMKVSNRLDARESIMAGAKYLSLLRDQMPERIAEPDRTWMALAAYNQGYGHLEDARILTERAGMNPDSWADVKKWMPRLNQPGYYKTLKHGYARGGEAVILVESIRSYYAMLKYLIADATPQEQQEDTGYQLPEPLNRLLGY